MPLSKEYQDYWNWLKYSGASSEGRIPTFEGFEGDATEELDFLKTLPESLSAMSEEEVAEWAKTSESVSRQLAALLEFHAPELDKILSQIMPEKGAIDKAIEEEEAGWSEEEKLFARRTNRKELDRIKSEIGIDPRHYEQFKETPFTDVLLPKLQAGNMFIRAVPPGFEAGSGKWEVGTENWAGKSIGQYGYGLGGSLVDTAYAALPLPTPDSTSQTYRWAADPIEILTHEIFGHGTGSLHMSSLEDQSHDAYGKLFELSKGSNWEKGVSGDRIRDWADWYGNQQETRFSDEYVEFYRFLYDNELLKDYEFIMNQLLPEEYGDWSIHEQMDKWYGSPYAKTLQAHTALSDDYFNLDYPLEFEDLKAELRKEAEFHGQSESGIPLGPRDFFGRYVMHGPELPWEPTARVQEIYDEYNE